MSVFVKDYATYKSRLQYLSTSDISTDFRRTVHSYGQTQPYSLQHSVEEVHKDIKKGRPIRAHKIKLEGREAVCIDQDMSHSWESTQQRLSLRNHWRAEKTNEHRSSTPRDHA